MKLELSSSNVSTHPGFNLLYLALAPPEEENSEYSSGVRQSARISFDDELFIGQRQSKKATPQVEERVVEGQGVEADTDAKDASVKPVPDNGKIEGKEDRRGKSVGFRNICRA